MVHTDTGWVACTARAGLYLCAIRRIENSPACPTSAFQKLNSQPVATTFGDNFVSCFPFRFHHNSFVFQIKLEFWKHTKNFKSAGRC